MSIVQQFFLIFFETKLKDDENKKGRRGTPTFLYSMKLFLTSLLSSRRG